MVRTRNFLNFAVENRVNGLLTGAPLADLSDFRPRGTKIGPTSTFGALQQDPRFQAAIAIVEIGEGVLMMVAPVPGSRVVGTLVILRGLDNAQVAMRKAFFDQEDAATAVNNVATFAGRTAGLDDKTAEGLGFAADLGADITTFGLSLGPGFVARRGIAAVDDTTLNALQLIDLPEDELAELLLRSGNDPVLARGTTEGFEGGPASSGGNTSVSIDPITAIAFAIDSQKQGTPIILLGRASDFGGTLQEGNMVYGRTGRYLKLEREVKLAMTPLETRALAPVEISLQRALEILGELGVKINNSSTNAHIILDGSPNLSPAQVEQFYIKARNSK